MIEQVRCKCGAAVELEVPEDMAPRWKESLRRMGGVCAACTAAERVNTEAKCSLDGEKVIAARLQSSEIPKGLQRLRFEGLDIDAGNRAAVDEAKRWASGGTAGVFLTGGIGVGKTTIAAAAAGAYLRRGRLRWTSMPRVFALLGVGGTNGNRRTATELLTGKGALVLDDIDKARPTEYGAEVVFGLIDHRITEGAPLFVTANLDYAALAQKWPEPFGEAIASRLAGYCGVAIEVQGDDRRITDLRAPRLATEAA